MTLIILWVLSSYKWLAATILDNTNRIICNDGNTLSDSATLEESTFLGNAKGLLLSLDIKGSKPLSLSPIPPTSPQNTKSPFKWNIKFIDKLRRRSMFSFLKVSAFCIAWLHTGLINRSNSPTEPHKYFKTVFINCKLYYRLWLQSRWSLYIVVPHHSWLLF